MWYKILTALKFIICLTVGPALICGFIVTVFGEDSFSTVASFISCFLWISYCWNFYYPRKNNIAPKKDDDNEIDFKDL